MSLIFDGVTIPTDVANSISMDGVDVTQVIIDGVTVWTQNLFSATWSGNSILLSGVGIETSGSTFRSVSGASVGSWISVNTLGIFENGQSQSTIVGNVNTFMSGGDTGTSTNGLAFSNAASPILVGELLFTIEDGFVGTSNVGNNGNIKASGGQMRMEQESNGEVAAWITLT